MGVDTCRLHESTEAGALDKGGLAWTRDKRRAKSFMAAWYPSRRPRPLDSDAADR